MAERMVLFGGTFDPVHHGHLIVARAVAEQCGYDRITLVPTRTPPHKAPACAEAADRLAMLHLAVEGEGLLDVCETELHRDGPSYTFDTLEALRRRRGEDVELHLVMGADMLEDLPTWHRAADVVASARMVVAARPPWQQRIEEILDGLRGRLPAAAVDRLAASIVATPLIDISSTAIRRRVAAGQSIRFLVPEKVRTYILQRGLYDAGGRPPQPDRSTPERNG